MALPLGTPAAYAAELLGTFLLVQFIAIVLRAQERIEKRPIDTLT
jgi:hypothetical protein